MTSRTYWASRALQTAGCLALLGTTLFQSGCKPAKRGDAALFLSVSANGNATDGTKVCQPDLDPEDCATKYSVAAAGKVVTLTAKPNEAPYIATGWTIERTDLNTEAFSGGPLQDLRDARKLEAKYGDYEGYVSREDTSWEQVNECDAAVCELKLNKNYEYRATVNFEGYCLGDASDPTRRKSSTLGPWAATINALADLHHAFQDDTDGADAASIYGTPTWGIPNAFDYHDFKVQLAMAATRTFEGDGENCIGDLSTYLPLVHTFTSTFDEKWHEIPTDEFDEPTASPPPTGLLAFYKKHHELTPIFGGSSELYLSQDLFTEDATESRPECRVVHELAHMMNSWWFDGTEQERRARLTELWVCHPEYSLESGVADLNEEPHALMNVDFTLAAQIKNGELKNPGYDWNVVVHPQGVTSNIFQRTSLPPEIKVRDFAQCNRHQDAYLTTLVDYLSRNVDLMAPLFANDPSPQRLQGLAQSISYGLATAQFSCVSGSRPECSGSQRSWGFFSNRRVHVRLCANKLEASDTTLENTMFHLARAFGQGMALDNGDSITLGGSMASAYADYLTEEYRVKAFHEVYPLHLYSQPDFGHESYAIRAGTTESRLRDVRKHGVRSMKLSTGFRTKLCLGRSGNRCKACRSFDNDDSDFSDDFDGLTRFREATVHFNPDIGEQLQAYHSEAFDILTGDDTDGTSPLDSIDVNLNEAQKQEAISNMSVAGPGSVSFDHLVSVEPTAPADPSLPSEEFRCARAALKGASELVAVVVSLFTAIAPTIEIEENEALVSRLNYLMQAGRADNVAKAVIDAVNVFHDPHASTINRAAALSHIVVALVYVDGEENLSFKTAASKSALNGLLWISKQSGGKGPSCQRPGVWAWHMIKPVALMISQLGLMAAFPEAEIPVLAARVAKVLETVLHAGSAVEEIIKAEHHCRAAING